MTITINPYKAFIALVGVLAVFYAVNIYTTAKLANVLIDEPIQLTFIIIEAPEGVCEKQCIQPDQIIKVIDQSHNIRYTTASVAEDSPIAKKYIEMYNIKTLPAIIASGDVANEKLLGAWNAFGGRVSDDNVIIAGIVPSYDIASQEVKGIVDVVLLSDATCDSCFDVQAYLTILQRFGVVTGAVQTYDIADADGQAYVQKYNIKKVPAMIASPDVRLYTNLSNVWSQIGTVASDGRFVFREVQKLSPEYKSL